MHTGCQYIGPEQDPRRGLVHYCGKPTVGGKSYCADHYYLIYKKGTSVNGRRREKEVEREIEEIKHAQELEMDYE